LRSRLPVLRFSPLTIISVAVIVLLLYAQFVVTSGLFSRATLSTLTPLIAIMAIVAVGQAFVISTGGIDLSVPATMTFMGVILLKASGGENSGLVEALILCVVVCLVIGFVNGFMVEVLTLNALVVTLATGQLITGVMQLYSGQVLSVSAVPPQLSSIANANSNGLSYLLIVAVVVALLGTVFLHRITYGRRLVAASASKGAATLAGVNARRYRISAYMIASLTYGLAGVLLSGQIKTPDESIGDPYLLTSVVAVVLGGAVLTGGRVSPIATLLGAVFLVILDYVLRVEGLSSGARLIVQGCVLVLSLSLVFIVRNLGAIGRTLARGRTRAPDIPITTTTGN